MRTGEWKPNRAQTEGEEGEVGFRSEWIDYIEMGGETLLEGLRFARDRSGRKWLKDLDACRQKDMAKKFLFDLSVLTLLSLVTKSALYTVSTQFLV